VEPKVSLVTNRTNAVGSPHSKWQSALFISTTTLTAPHGFVPHWQNDTLYSYKISDKSVSDSMFSFTNGDTSYVMWRGIKLYVYWIYDANTPSYFNDSMTDDTYCYIGPVAFDTTKAWSLCDVYGSGYWNLSPPGWVSGAAEVIQLYNMSKFDTAYNSLYIYHR